MAYCELSNCSLLLYSAQIQAYSITTTSNTYYPSVSSHRRVYDTPRCTSYYNATIHIRYTCRHLSQVVIVDLFVALTKTRVGIQPRVSSQGVPVQSMAHGKCSLPECPFPKRTEGAKVHDYCSRTCAQKHSQSFHQQKIACAQQAGDVAGLSYTIHC